MVATKRVSIEFRVGASQLPFLLPTQGRRSRMGGHLAGAKAEFASPMANPSSARRPCTPKRRSPWGWAAAGSGRPWTTWSSRCTRFSSREPREAVGRGPPTFESFLLGSAAPSLPRIPPRSCGQASSLHDTPSLQRKYFTLLGLPATDVMFCLSAFAKQICTSTSESPEQRKEKRCLESIGARARSFLVRGEPYTRTKGAPPPCPSSPEKRPPRPEPPIKATKPEAPEAENPPNPPPPQKKKNKKNPRIRHTILRPPQMPRSPPCPEPTKPLGFRV